MNVLVYVVLAFVPAGFFLALAKAIEWWSLGSDVARPTEGPAGPPVERLAGDLRRLERDYRRIERSDLPCRASRRQSVMLAYDDTLCACCTRLGIPWAGRPPFNALERLDIEASLAQRGLTW